jgi:hypothetical protein
MAKKRYVCTKRKFFQGKRYSLTYSIHHEKKDNVDHISHLSYNLYDSNLLPKDLKRGDSIIPHINSCKIDERVAYNARERDKIEKFLKKKKCRLENKHKEQLAYLKSIKDYVKNG